MTSTTWESPRYVQELATIEGPQNRTQGSCEGAASEHSGPGPWDGERVGEVERNV